MQLTRTAAVSLAIFLSLAKADFELFRTRDGDALGGILEGWAIFDDIPNCDQAGDARFYSDESDVSGGTGVRCEGDGCAPSEDPAGIEVVEMNFGSDEYHFTMYQDRDRQLYTLDGEVVGRCEPYGGHDHDCNVDNIGRILGYSKLYCYSRYTADEIQENA